MQLAHDLAQYFASVCVDEDASAASTQPSSDAHIFLTLPHPCSLRLVSSCSNKCGSASAHVGGMVEPHGRFHVAGAARVAEIQCDEQHCTQLMFAHAERLERTGT